MKVHIVTKLARQVEGEQHFINILGAFTDSNKATEFVKAINYKPAEIIDNVPCLVDIGILYDVEVIE